MATGVDYTTELLYWILREQRVYPQSFKAKCVLWHFKSILTYLEIDDRESWMRLAFLSLLSYASSIPIPIWLSGSIPNVRKRVRPSSLSNSGVRFSKSSVVIDDIFFINGASRSSNFEKACICKMCQNKPKGHQIRILHFWIPPEIISHPMQHNSHNSITIALPGR